MTWIAATGLFAFLDHTIYLVFLIIRKSHSTVLYQTPIIDSSLRLKNRQDMQTLSFPLRRPHIVTYMGKLIYRAVYISCMIGPLSYVVIVMVLSTRTFSDAWLFDITE